MRAKQQFKVPFKPAPAGCTNKSRKQLRKEQRKHKKARRLEYYTSRHKPGKYVLNPDKDFNESTRESEQDSKTKEVKVTNIVKQNIDYTEKRKREHDRLVNEMNKQRSKQLKKANEEEDRNIKKLEKQLHLKKRKSKNVPKSFTEDGLDYLLEVCDSENLKAVVAAEQQFNEVNDEFEEDLALMTGKQLNPEQLNIGTLKKEDDEDSDNDDEEDKNKYVNSPDEESESDDESNEAEVDHSDSDLHVDSIEESAHTEVSSVEEEEEDNKSGASETLDEESNNKEKQSDGVWEDIYGRIRNKEGGIIEENTGKYIPPSLRAKMEVKSDVKHSEKLKRLQRQLKGLFNRLAESNMHNIATQIEELYMNNSRNDMNDTVTTLIIDSVVTTVLTPERLLLEHVSLIAVLHANVGTEVGAHFLQVAVKKFDELYAQHLPVENKMLDNAVCIIAQLYNYKICHPKLIYEMLDKLTDRFDETDIECVLLILKSIGFSLRKDDPLALKSLIINLQKQASSANEKTRDNPRVKFMLDILLAIKNNNMTKIPNYDTTYAEHLKKLQKGFIRKGSYVTTLNISLQDLLKVDQCGKWWVVGSAWSGQTIDKLDDNESVKVDSFSQKLLDLARKQRMNTDTRRSIFCIIMSSEDYLDAFEKLLRLGLKNQQEREIINVILHCCLQEKAFNPYYAILAQKLCEYDRKFQMTIKYSTWDKIKTLTECSTIQLSNLAKLLTHLFLEKGLPISTLKIVQFSELDKITLRFIRQILIGILVTEDEETCQGVFSNISQSEKLKMFRESLRLFIRHFLLRNLKSDVVPEKHMKLLEERSNMVDKILSFSEKKVKF